MPPKKTSTASAAKPATRATRASTAKTAATAAAAAPTSTTTPKANGKKRAAADDESAAPAAKSITTAATSAAAKKPRTKKTASAAPVEEQQEDEDAGDVNEREIIASLSDVSADSSDDDDDENENDDEDEGANSSDEDDEDDRLASSAANTQPRSSLASVKLPNSKDDAVVKARLDKLRKSKASSKNSAAATVPGVLYIGRLPKGFFEKQLKSYFSQFGDVTRLRVSRNKKTGASKHYAFIEFADQDVAQIVQETMHNYLIDGRLLQVKQVSKDKIHPELWIGANRKFQKVPGARLERVVRGREKTEEEQKRTNDRALKRQDDRRAKLEKLGIDYDFEGYTQQQADSSNKSNAAKKTTTTTTTASAAAAAAAAATEKKATSKAKATSAAKKAKSAKA